MGYHLLVYGDSNSWGYLDDGQGLRYEARWPVAMAEALRTQLNTDIYLYEEALPGRTTAYRDPQEGPEYNGLPYLKPALLSHAPIDMVLIMLGTNDAKARFDASADAITDNLIQLAKIARRAPVGQGKWREAPPPKVMLIAPANLGPKSIDPSWLRYEEWLGGAQTLADIPALLAQKIKKLGDDGISFADANQAVSPSMRDPIHWPMASHQDMGQMIARAVADQLS